jgi:Down syndrome cell adhesion molecule
MILSWHERNFSHFSYFDVLTESPDAPTNLEVLEVKSRTLKLSWKRPYDGNSPVLSYQVQYKPLRSLHDQAVISSPEEEWKGQHIFNLTLPSVGVATR